MLKPVLPVGSMVRITPMFRRLSHRRCRVGDIGRVDYYLGRNSLPFAGAPIGTVNVYWVTVDIQPTGLTTYGFSDEEIEPVD